MTDSAGRDQGRPEAAHAGEETRPEGADAMPGPPDLHRLAQDWITLWQSELTAMAADREMQETWQATIGLWAAFATAMVKAMPPSSSSPKSPSPPEAHDPALVRRAGESGAGSAARAADAARSTPAAAAPDPRNAEVKRLGRHIAALEARLAELERRGNGKPAPSLTGRRKR